MLTFPPTPQLWLILDYFQAAPSLLSPKNHLVRQSPIVFQPNCIVSPLKKRKRNLQPAPSLFVTDSLMRFFLGNKKLNTLNSEKMCGLLVSDQADAPYFFGLRCPVMPSETSVLVSEAAPHSLSQGPPGLQGLGPRINETASPGGQVGNGRSQEIEWFPVWKPPERQTAQVRQEMPSLAGVFWPGRSFLKERSIPAFIPKPRGTVGREGR